MAKLILALVAVSAATGCNRPMANEEVPSIGGEQQTPAEILSMPKLNNEAEVTWHRATGALDPECSHSGKNPDGSYEFMVPCPASFTSPDGQWKIVMGRETPEGNAPVTLHKGEGSYFAAIRDLSDGMPFQVFWSPRPNWFLVNHHVGSFMRKPQVYEITKEGVVRHKGITEEGGKLAKQISPCLRAPKWDWANGEAVGWSRDGRAIAWLFYTHTTACLRPGELGPVPPNRQWKAFWMISNAKTGEIAPGSIRINKTDGPSKFPNDAMYAEFRNEAL